MAMKISYFTAGHSKYPIERAYEAAAKYGYDAIEIGGFRPHAHTWDILNNGLGAKIRKLSADHGLPVVSYAPENTGSPHSFVFEDKKLNEESLEYFKRTLDAAKEIGSMYCMFACNHPGYGRKKEDVKKLFIENMHVLAEYAQSIQQTIILEPVTPYEGTIICTSDDVLWALNEVDNPYFKAMLDLACPVTCREPVSEYFEKLGGDVKHIHFIDCTPDSEDHLLPGDGSIDFPRLTQYLSDVGYDGYLSIEIFSRYETEPDYAAERGCNAIRELLAGVK